MASRALLLERHVNIVDRLRPEGAEIDQRETIPGPFNETVGTQRDGQEIGVRGYHREDDITVFSDFGR